MQLTSAPDRNTAGADLAACQSLLRSGSRSFHAASLLLPRRIHEPAAALYAFCRVADDAIDTGVDAPAALVQLRERLALAYAGRPAAIAADRAFAEVVQRFSIPHELPAALLEGFEWDATGRRYETLHDVDAYASRVAGTVGVMMSLLMEQRSPEVLARACDLGIAMQLTNIARDVGEDARAGRLYLPRQWLAEAGIDADAWLAAPQFSPALAGVVQRLLECAALRYERAAEGIAWLPWVCRPGMHAARLIYSEIGASLRSRGLDSISQRARVSGLRKAQLMAAALTAATRPKARLAATVADEVRFLVDAVAPLPAHAVPHGTTSAGASARVIWLLDLFERLERQQRTAR